MSRTDAQNGLDFHFKDDVKSVLRIGSAHNKGGPADINIAQISHISNFSDRKRWFIFMYEHSKAEQIDIQFSTSYFTNIAVQNVNKEFVYMHYGLYSIFKKFLL